MDALILHGMNKNKLIYSKLFIWLTYHKFKTYFHKKDDNNQNKTK